MIQRKSYEYLLVTRPSQFVAHVQLNRPELKNAINHKMNEELGDVFEELSVDPDTRAIIISGCGKSFCAGIDLKESLNIVNSALEGEDAARMARRIREKFKESQKTLNAISECPKPIIAAIHGQCIGGGMDLIALSDIRYATTDAQFSMKEVDIAMTADPNTLSRLPRICGNESWIRELVFTARTFDAEEALQYDLILKVYDSHAEVIKGAERVSLTMSNRSPVAIQSAKTFMEYARDHSVEDSLRFSAAWNQSQLQTEDVHKAAQTALLDEQHQPQYSKL
ncbi:hypothetical protein L596_011543 [Steinernema carpocapsae]|uniref:Delta(3,5)-Delta(2,4)-dienoyl-CoA isomerase, mitochondrial n=1 Tax=Steinernema carpocapsae TaxID=34508 RepID=A0A4U5NU91_STECR|nr:hypothetical protein L596_011543 [Steinernema carpocapsae]